MNELAEALRELTQAEQALVDDVVGSGDTMTAKDFAVRIERVHAARRRYDEALIALGFPPVHRH